MKKAMSLKKEFDDYKNDNDIDDEDDEDLDDFLGSLGITRPK